ncbi:hypothetical protein WG908_06350 [Sphingobium sp. AN641]|uniref:hypothetical protein n=1 Tax=Sphingobium sp. AN641 TaxID=3133443 RepID=UPI0030BE39D0
MLDVKAGRHGLFDPPPYYGTPGIGDDLPRAQRQSIPTGFFGKGVSGSLARSTAGADIGSDEGPAPVSLMPLHAELQRPGMPSVQPVDASLTKGEGFFSSQGGWRDLVGAISDGLAGAAGMQPTYGPAKMRQRQQQSEWERQDSIRQQDRQWQTDDRDWKAKQPDYFNSGKDRVSFNPTTGEAKVVYDAPEDFQIYADLLGLAPGTDEYDAAVQDYVLRSYGPTAQDGRVDLENVRQENRVGLEGVRQGNRMALRQTPTYSNLLPRAPAGGGGGGGGGRPPRTTGNVYAPILAKMAAGQTLTPAEQKVMSFYGRGGRSGRGGTGAGTVGLPVMKTPGEANRLPKGTRYRTPDGKVMER